MSRSGSRSVGRCSPASRSRNGWVTRYSCANGTTGTRTPGQPADLGGEHAAGVDDDLGLDVAPLGPDAAHAAVGDVDPGHARVREDLAAALARALDRARR